MANDAEPDLDLLREAASAEAERDTEEVGPPQSARMSEILARARELAEHPEEVVDADPGSETGFEAELQPFIVSARAHAERDLRSKDRDDFAPSPSFDAAVPLSASPPVDPTSDPDDGTITIRPRRWGIPVAVLLTAAAGALVWLAAAVRDPPVDAVPMAAPPSVAVPRVEPPVARPAPASTVDLARDPDGIEGEEETSPANDDSAAARDEPAHPAETRRPSKPSLEALDKDAQRALARGDLESADEALAELIRRGGNGRLVELAYGDRFTIARRRGMIGEEKSLWRAYLQRFPKGRFADDARFGLCRHATTQTARRCWTAYLADFPQGAYRSQAEAALSEAEAR